MSTCIHNLPGTLCFVTKKREATTFIAGQMFFLIFPMPTESRGMLFTADSLAPICCSLSAGGRCSLQQIKIMAPRAMKAATDLLGELLYCFLCIVERDV